MIIGETTIGRSNLPLEQAILISTEDGICPARIYKPEEVGHWPAVIFLMDGYGLRKTLFDMAQRLAGYGYVVLVPDLYYRSGPYRSATAEEISDPVLLQARLSPWITSTDNRKAAKDIQCFLDFLGSRSDVLGSGAGIVGYCLSGAMALAAAGTDPERIHAAASFHGGALATDSPISPHLLAGSIKARILVAVADNDPYYPPEMNDRLKAALFEAGVNHSIEIYAGAQHGWTMCDFSVYDHDAAERHWEALITLFRETLGG